MRINVTQEHIEDGVPDQCSRCPIALALRDTNQFERVRVCNFALWLDKTEYTPSRAVMRFIRRFDGGEPVKPFSFNLNIPEAK